MFQIVKEINKGQWFSLEQFTDSYCLATLCKLPVCSNEHNWTNCWPLPQLFCLSTQNLHKKNLLLHLFSLHVFWCNNSKCWAWFRLENFFCLKPPKLHLFLQIKFSKFCVAIDFVQNFRFLTTRPKLPNSLSLPSMSRYSFRKLLIFFNLTARYSRLLNTRLS